jgi:2-desacetyl-2-hydroxyethyl bacteriochlorophyllide A dehydrogenase
MVAEARAFWTTGPGRGAIRTTELAPLVPGTVLVETLYSGISRGTETLVFLNRVPASQIQVMRCPFQEGAFPAPVKYGYAAVGRIVDGAAEDRDRHVFVLHPHQDRFVVPAAAAMPIPETVPPARAVLAANVETALNGLWDSGIAAGDRVCVIGAGVVGLLVAWLASRIPAVNITLYDIDPLKEIYARRLAIPFQADPPERGDYDVVIHASGNPAGLAYALALAGFEATIVEMSWYGDRSAVLPLGEDFHSRRLTIRSSQVGGIPAARRARWPHRRRLETAMDLLNDPLLDALISGESGFDELPQVMAALADGSMTALCHRIRYTRD